MKVKIFAPQQTKGLATGPVHRASAVGSTGRRGTQLRGLLLYVAQGQFSILTSGNVLMLLNDNHKKACLSVE